MITQENSKTIPNPIIINSNLENITRLVHDIKRSISERIILSSIDDGRRTPSSFIKKLYKQLGIDTILALIQDFKVDRLDNIYTRSEENFSQIMDYNISKTMSTYDRIQTIISIFN